jgi:hypothetical protein
MHQRFFFTICFSLLFYCAVAQETEVIENSQNLQYKPVQQQTQTKMTQKKAPYQKPWSFGGNVGLSFWNGGTDILLGPKAYYHVSPQFLTGFGLTYIYSSANDDFAKYSQNSFGASVMGAYRPIPFLQFSAEYEGLQTNGDATIKFSGNREKNSYSYWNNAIYLGASFVSRNVSFGLRYDVLYDSNRSVYGSAWSPVIGFYF